MQIHGAVSEKGIHMEERQTSFPDRRSRASMEKRQSLKDKKRIVIKVGSNSLVHPETGELNLSKIDHLIRVLADLKGEGRDVVLVSSGAVACGRQALKIGRKPGSMTEKQAFAAVGQAKLMSTYQRFFAEYSQTTAQVLLTKNVIINQTSRDNTKNTFDELLKLGVIPVVNENDTISTQELAQLETFGDNDQLASIVGAVIGADLVILLSDIEGMYTDDPRHNRDAVFIEYVPMITEEILGMGKGAGSDVGTGGMSAKIAAARIATDSDADMVIAKFDSADIIFDILKGKNVGTLFAAHKNENFDLAEFIRRAKDAEE